MIPAFCLKQSCFTYDENWVSFDIRSTLLPLCPKLYRTPALVEVSYEFESVCTFVRPFPTQDIRIDSSSFSDFLCEIR